MSATTPSDDQIKQYIVTSVGDYNGVVAANIDLIWQLCAVYAPYPALQALHATRAALSLLMGQVWQAVNATVDDTRESLSDLFDHLTSRLGDTDKQIALATTNALATSGLGTASGAFANDTPPIVVRPPGDPNSVVYLGWPVAPGVVG